VPSTPCRAPTSGAASRLLTGRHPTC
jgi:hypothetical protein